MKDAFQKAKNYYLTHGDATYKSVAKRYDLSERTLRDRACREKWRDQRKEYQKKYEKKVVEMSQKKTAEEEFDTLTSYLNISKLLMAKLEVAIETVGPGDIVTLQKIISALRNLRYCLLLDKVKEEPQTVRIELSKEWLKILDESDSLSSDSPKSSV